MSSRPKIFLTRQLPSESMQLLKSQSELTYNHDDRYLSKEEIIAEIQGVDGLLCLLTDTIDDDVLGANPDLKVVANFAVGFNNIDVAAATARGIPVTNTPGVLTDTTADMAWALLLAAGRRVVEGDRFVRSRQWQGWGPLQFLGGDVTGSTLGLIGFGRIAQAVARRARGFDMKILYWNRTRLSADEESKLGVQYASMDDVLAKSDFVSVHVALNDQTRHLIGPRELSLMKSTASIINTARGPIIDEAAMVDALKNGSIASAGLDVYENEPQLEPELYDLANVVIAPHLGSATIGTRTKMGNMAAENCLAACRGQVPPNLVNPESLD
ncbi:Putative 2-hydroxyacid dehydrogenase [Rubripirellula lacrimiformis]|uniref:2-hydroxyacid dehydrogenase n=1 Tax=Rubripirellula lacrimiformis TaxID=1930273 RepID=A0A517NFF1_9BACT|nr:D-glycerate dehydrogenase [Rubripirellula lacrimiformis]QDT05847.1 Putative 2-hydroxyacid dehydrogenase [Rubripirellula lacrimiformis]